MKGEEEEKGRERGRRKERAAAAVICHMYASSAGISLPEEVLVDLAAQGAVIVQVVCWGEGVGMREEGVWRG
jgi:hypothetical protein